MSAPLCTDDDKKKKAKPTCAHSVDCSRRIYAAGQAGQAGQGVKGLRGWQGLSEECRGVVKPSPSPSPSGYIRQDKLACDDAGPRGVTRSDKPCARSIQCSNEIVDNRHRGYHNIHPSCLRESSRPSSPHTPKSPSAKSPQKTQQGAVKTPTEIAKKLSVNTVRMGRDGKTMYVVSSVKSWKRQARKEEKEEEEEDEDACGQRRQNYEGGTQRARTLHSIYVHSLKNH